MNSVQAQSIEKIVALIRANDIRLADIEQALQYPPAHEEEETQEEPKKTPPKKK
jgi:hypothetical protein